MGRLRIGQARLPAGAVAGLQWRVRRDLAGQPLGETVEQIEQRLGDSLERLVGIEVAVRLPGKITSNAPLEASNGARWEPGLADPEPAHLRASGRERNMAALAWAATAVVAGVLFVVSIVLAVRQRRRRGSPKTVTPSN